MISIIEQEPYKNQDVIMNAVNEYLQDVYCRVYDGNYRIFKDDIRYSLYLDFMNRDKPMIISGEFFNDEAFTEYIKKEMRARHLFDNNYYTVRRVNEEDIGSCNN